MYAIRVLPDAYAQLPKPCKDGKMRATRLESAAAVWRSKSTASKALALYRAAFPGYVLKLANLDEPERRKLADETEMPDFETRRIAVRLLGLPLLRDGSRNPHFFGWPLEHNRREYAAALESLVALIDRGEVSPREVAPSLVAYRHEECCHVL